MKYDIPGKAVAFSSATRRALLALFCGMFAGVTIASAQPAATGARAGTTVVADA